MIDQTSGVFFVAEPRGLDGCREVDGKLMGRVSHISGYRVQKEAAKSQKTLADWREWWTKENPDLPDDFHSQRGTLFHSACEHRLIHGEDPTELHEWIKPFYPQARGILAQYGKVYWAEKPIDESLPWPDLSFQTEQGETRWHVWKEFYEDVPVIDPETGEQAIDPETGEPLTEEEYQRGYCGTPDLVARWRGKVCLSDWKTSEKLYVPSRPKFMKPQTDANAERLRKERVNGWYKYVRTCRQLAAYLMALEERLDRPGWIEVATINVVLPHCSQQLPIYRNELLGAPWQEFCKLLQQWQAGE